MSGTKVKTLLKNLKTQDESTLEAFQELPITFRDVSSTTPAPLDVYLSENKAFIKMPGAGDSAASSTWTANPTTADSTVRVILDDDAAAPGAAIKAATAANSAYVSVDSSPATGDVIASIGTSGASGVASILATGSDISITAATSSSGQQTKVFLDGSENKVSVSGSLDVNVEDHGGLPADMFRVNAETSAGALTPILSVQSAIAGTIALANTNISGDTVLIDPGTSVSIVSPSTSLSGTLTNLNSISTKVGGTLHVGKLSPNSASHSNTIVITNENQEDSGADVILSLQDLMNTSCKINLIEAVDADDPDETPQYGGSISYSGSGDYTGAATQGDNIFRISSINNATTNDILSFSYTGNNVKLESQEDLTLLVVEDHSEITIEVRSADQARNSKIYLNGGDNNNNGLPKMEFSGARADFLQGLDCDSATFNGLVTANDRVTLNDNLYLTNVPSGSSDTITQRYIGIDENTGKVYINAQAQFFSGGHIYSSDTQLPVGTAVELSSNKLQASSTSSSKIVVGIVARQQECTSEAPVKTSFGDERSSGYATKVVALGDTRLMDCQGFNVCNESGAIVPGDLLVTSSTPGYLMKQADDIIRSSTVGKAMEQVTFDENGQATGVYGYLYCG
jgi:hypothetical protein